MDQSGGEQPGWKFWTQRRYVVTLLAFLGFFNVYSLRVNLSVGIVAMTSPQKIVTENGTQYSEPDFDWDSKTQGLILSSFFYGYLCTQLLGGWFGTKYGGATVYGLGVTTTAFLTLITPLTLSTSSYYPLVALRIIEGLFEGVTYPCIHTVWAKWAPPSERASMASFAFSGSYVGTVIAMPMSGVLAEHWGWPSIFYVTGVVGLIWACAWYYIVKNTPEDDIYVTPEEHKYLKESLGDVKTTEIVHPWKEFVKSMPLWAIVMAHFCENWGFYTLLTQLPTFMKDTLNFDLTKAGVLASLPYLVMAIIMQFAGRLSDWLCNKKILSVTNVRKTFNCTAFLSQTVFMVLAAHLMTPAGVTTCLVLAVGLGAFAWPAFGVNHLDIAPQHAGVLMGFSNTFGTLPGILSPLITGFIVTNRTADEWAAVFYIAATLYLIGAIFYCIFASAERQPWAMDKEETNKKKETNAYVNGALSIDETQAQQTV
ncbi:vesicular glutamate transporter 3 [Halyomorpha halys]|uniref:vesicular glutamate transporter 3 n=1 Tax=Halyomorpha halys TaxID=286706 RepID=UPI0006D50979|nr:vesicular glutamate transporter 3 [Halyomorpha halys]